MNQNQDFTQATRLFHLSQYEQGLQKISNCILAHPEHSMLYSNRALFYYQMKSNQKALRDLQTSIQINYLNYIAYFNLFSIQLRIGGLEKQAFQDLCCSLSILYFLRAKTKKTQIDVQKSLKYCENNIQAHVLKGMMHLQNNKLKLATNEIQWALQFQPQNIVLKRLKHYLKQKVGYLNYQEEQIEQNPFLIKERYVPQRRRRLQCTLQLNEQADIDNQIRQKLEQFTQIYNDLNSQTGTVTQRILIQNDDHAHLETSIISQISGIYQSYKKQKIFVRQDAQSNFVKKLSSQEYRISQQEIVVYDNIVLKEYDPDHDKQELGQKQFILDDFLEENLDNSNNQIRQIHQAQHDFLERPSDSSDYFVMNERQDFLNTSTPDKQESLEIPYQLLNKQFNKKEEDNNQSPIDILKENKFEIQQNKINIDQRQFDLCQQPIVLHQFNLPEPQFIIEHDFYEISEKEEHFEQTPYKKQRVQEDQNLLEEVEQHEGKPFIELQETDQYSDAILSYSSETKGFENYGQILIKQNRNIKFHQSQVMQLNNQKDSNAQITLIDDLISQSSNTNRQSRQNSASFSKKKKLAEQNSYEQQNRIVKSLDNTMKRPSKKQQKLNQDQNVETFKFQLIQLYPFTLPKKQIFFNFVNVQFSKKYKTSTLDQLYLVAVYHLSIPKYKMKTQPRKMQGTFCIWNEKFPQMNLLEQPRNLKITVFNKAKGMKNRDQLLGEAQKQITQTGQLRLPLYQKKLLVGYVKCSVWSN